MKKLVFMFVAAMAISFASCGGQTAANVETVDSDTVVAVVEEVVDSAAAVVDTVATEAAEAATEVVEEAAEVVAE